METIKNFKDKDGGRVVGGLILVGIGAAFLLRNLDFDMPHWIFSWPMILILVGIHNGFKHNFRNNSWLIILGIGLFFLISPYFSFNLKRFWPIGVIIAGVAFIMRPDRNGWMNNAPDPGTAGFRDMDSTAYSDVTPAAHYDASDYLSVKSVFSGMNRNVVSKNFKGGTITAVFGGSQIDFRQADITAPVIVKLEIVFGGAKLIVPPHWAVVNEIDGVFHGVDDKRSFNPAADINPEKVLILRGSAVFGGVEIRSY